MEDKKKIKKKKSNKKNNIIFGIIFIIGLLILIYPMISEIYYSIDQNDTITKYEKDVQSMPKENIEEQLRQAYAFNEKLFGGSSAKVFTDPFSDESISAIKEYSTDTYPELFKSKKVIGYIKIPAINQKLAIKNGVGEDVLQECAGYLPNTSLPVGGINTHTVITAHRGLPRFKLFREIDKLKKGDKFYLYVLDQKLAYEVEQTKIVLPSDTKELSIIEGHDYATLLSCHPYTINSHRILVRGKRVPYVEDDDRATKNVKEFPIDIKILLGILFIIIVILSIIIKNRRDKRIKRKRLKRPE